MEEKTKNDLKAETIGIPKISMLSKEDYKQFITLLEFQVREYYKNIPEKEIKKPP